jgi:hypothetical protein
MLVRGLVALIGLVACATSIPAQDPPANADATKRHWAFQPLARLERPPITNSGRARTPIDEFVLEKLQAKRLTFAADADRVTLVRRAYLDLLGLPPSPKELDEFLRDRRADAYEQLLDRLLASPHFGERWGRHWLDNAGYVDVTGTDNDATIIRLGENRWKYRDYVIRAFNSDKPFDRFLLEQLAGDELLDWRRAAKFTPEMLESLVATGFLRTAADDTEENELNTMDIRYGVLHRTIEAVAGNLLGVTLQCAKCHDHKYEPISHKDYYRFQALFQPAFNPQQWLQPTRRQLAAISPAEKQAIEKIREEIEAWKKRQDEARQPAVARLREAKLAQLPEAARVAVQTPAAKRNPDQQALAKQHELALQQKGDEVAAALSAEDKARVAECEKHIRALEPKIRTWEHLQAVYDVGPPTATHLLKRGIHDRPGAEVPVGFLNVLAPTDEQTRFLGARSEGNSSGRRLALARWLTDPGTTANSLVLRVRVNRIWQQLFGKGLVATSDNLGITGSKPSHPELLDWLALEFRGNGLRLKPLLKLMMTSTTYRQSSMAASTSPDPQTVDPDNVLLWRMRLRRLESEIIRDSVLAASGKLDRAQGGPPIPVEPRPDGTFVVKEQGLPTPTSAWRRSVYLLARRNYHPTMLNVFDQPNLTTNCPCRTPSAVVLQTLTMLNDPFMLEQARFLAERVERGGNDDAARVTAAFRLTLSREPSAKENQASLALLQRQRELYLGQKMPADAAARQELGHLCHMLLNTSEFLYIP